MFWFFFGKNHNKQTDIPAQKEVSFKKTIKAKTFGLRPYVQESFFIKYLYKYSSIIETLDTSYLNLGTEIKVTDESIQMLSAIDAHYRERFKTKHNFFINLGICVAHFPLSNLYEQVIQPHVNHCLNKDVQPIKLENIRIMEWMPTASLSHPIKEIAFVASSPKNDIATDHIMKRLCNYLEQYYLVLSRIRFLKERKNRLIEESLFLKKMASLFMLQEFKEYCLKNKIILENDYKEIDKFFKKTPEDIAMQEEKILSLIKQNILSFVIASFLTDFGAFFHEVERGKKSYTGLMTTIKKIASWISHMDESFKKIHYIYYTSNDHFLNELGFFEGKLTTQQEYKEQMITDFLEKNFLSFETYKNLYARLFSLEAKELLSFLHEEFHRVYLNDAYGLSLAKFYIAIGNYEHAKKVIYELKKGKKNDSFLSFLLIKIDFELGQYKEVITQTKDIIELSEHKESLYNLIGVCYGKIKKFKEAATAYEKGIELYPFSYKLHHNLFLAYKALGRITDAKKIIKRSEGLKKS